MRYVYNLFPLVKGRKKEGMCVDMRVELSLGRFIQRQTSQLQFPDCLILHSLLISIELVVLCRLRHNPLLQRWVQYGLSGLDHYFHKY